MNIRDLTKNDFEAWRTLWNDYLEFYKTTRDQAQYALSFANILDPDKPQMQGRLAILDNQPIGLVHFLTHDHFWHSRPVVYLQDLFTAPSARGHGAGRALIEHVYQFAEDNNFASVYWTTQDFNTQARHLYDQIGELTPFIKYKKP